MSIGSDLYCEMHFSLLCWSSYIPSKLFLNHLPSLQVQLNVVTYTLFSLKLEQISFMTLPTLFLLLLGLKIRISSYTLSKKIHMQICVNITCTDRQKALPLEAEFQLWHSYATETCHLFFFFSFWALYSIHKVLCHGVFLWF